jgi:hypothetical protein
MATQNVGNTKSSYIQGYSNVCIGSESSCVEGYSNIIPSDAQLVDVNQNLNPQINELIDKIIERMFHQAIEDAHLLDQPGQGDKIIERMERNLKKDILH